MIDRDDPAWVGERLGRGGYVVVATQGRRDLQGLKAGLALRPSHLWFVASARKASVLRGDLLAAGEDADGVARIISPAGEPIGARTPEEIALSVLAGIVAARRGRGASHESGAPGGVSETPVAAGAAERPATVSGPCGDAENPPATEAFAPAVVPEAASPK